MQVDHIQEIKKDIAGSDMSGFDYSELSRGQWQKLQLFAMKSANQDVLKADIEKVREILRGVYSGNQKTNSISGE